jgi:hypothetical protein
VRRIVVGFSGGVSFTVYRVPASPSRRVRIVGRELKLYDAISVMWGLERRAKKGAGRT